MKEFSNQFGIMLYQLKSVCNIAKCTIPPKCRIYHQLSLGVEDFRQLWCDLPTNTCCLH
eukprot:NODE_2208_length_744_cov_76.410072_g1782_i0.p2 GENE.NODE_2208_length_744_cov_76.410072_g1782_i0~~NODE_2208_length_744_cov_76.410072_g1782_i0.p2  ORF type:complete len:59 (+),score=4.10 NODE_2208_length_744_cov_76.410072_g1782_i0:393-569(+)